MATGHALASLRKYIPAYEKLLVANLSFLLDRYERDPHYRFVDTKVNLITGEEFALASGRDIYRRDVLYTWIQGRGIEALAGYLAWLPAAVTLSAEDKALLAWRAERMMGEVLTMMEVLRARNQGRLCFMMSTEGTPLELGPHGEVRPLERIPGDANYSDLFYAKGLYVAGAWLKRDDLRAQAEAYFSEVVDAVLSGSFASDQQNLSRQNRVGEVQGRVSHGPFMIALGGVALLLASTSKQRWADTGEQLIRHVLQRHVNRGQFEGLQLWDFSEFLDLEGKPWKEDGRLLCDPGHAIEYVGLSCKVLLAALATRTLGDSLRCLAEECREAFPCLLPHLFRLGFNARHGGISKSVDLVSRQPVNTDMPWWSLPETLRATALLAQLWPRLDLPRLLFIYAQAHEAFFEGYLNPHLYHMAYQTRDVNGQPVDVIPSVPDADPGYHTGLSLIDVLKALYSGQTQA